MEGFRECDAGSSCHREASRSAFLLSNPVRLSREGAHLHALVAGNLEQHKGASTGAGLQLTSFHTCLMDGDAAADDVIVRSGTAPLAWDSIFTRVKNRIGDRYSAKDTLRLASDRTYPVGLF